LSCVCRVFPPEKGRRGVLSITEARQCTLVVGAALFAARWL
jgi:hypothetical protein